jgi:uncharacterized protein YggE
MSRSPVIPLSGLLALLLASPAALRADPPAAGTVSGSGTVEIKRQPEILRVQFEVMARGKTLKEALDKLKARRDEVRTELVKLGARKDAVTFGDPGLAEDGTNRRDRVEMLIRERNRALGKPKPKGDTPAVVAVMVRAEFPLAAADPEAFLVAARELQEKVKAAELGGLKDKSKLTPEEEEAAAEAIGGPGPGDGEPPRGEPVFLYVSKITEQERSKALAEAFAKAKREAERLARAAGGELGGLHHLANQFQSVIDPDELYGRRGFYPGRMVLGSSDDEADEAVGAQAGKVTLRVGVVVQFKLK